MPPRKGIVRSGNAGNSSKASKPPVEEKKGKGNDDPTSKPEAPPRPPPLFPPGYKTPLAILSEKCQKHGWEKPVVDTRANAHSEPQTFSAVVTLKKRKNKNLTDFDIVRLMPIPRIEATDSLMARHLGATYALFRFCSNLPMSMLLPPTIRPYWTTLQAEKARAEEHRAWEWAEDPFLAQKEVQARQEKRAAKQSAQQHANALDHGVEGRVGGGSSGGHGSGGRGGGGMWKSAPEVKMTPSQRELVEGVIRKMMRQYPTAVLEAAREFGATPSSANSGSATPALDLDSVEQQLKQLEFRPAHIKSCLRALASAYQRLHTGSTSQANDPLALSLSFLSPLEAAVEYLLAHLPEDDLPRNYRPAQNVADFVSDVVGPGGGQEGLRRAWLVDKLVKKAGFPRKVVDEIVTAESKEEVALDMLGRRLCGWVGEDDGWGMLDYGVGWEALDEAEERERLEARDEEITVLSSILDSRVSRLSPEEFVVRTASGNDILDIHFLFGTASPYPSARYPTYPPTFYLTSPTLPAYIRLHIHSQLFRAFRDTDRPDLAATLESGIGGACYLMVEMLETELQLALDSPPDVGTVTQHLVPTLEAVEVKPSAEIIRAAKRQRNRQATRVPTTEQHEAVLQQYRTMKARPGYDAMVASRSKLPAWGNREEINNLLKQNRVVIVVGETGSGKTTQIPQFILDHEIDSGRGASTSIVVTQPRRVSALGVAGRVAEERMENIDRTVETVGYAIRGESKVDPRRTRLSFVTTGVILRRLGTGDAELGGISHIVVDEVHERSVDGDFLLLQLKELLLRNKTIKVILMSATINQQTFIDYFNGAPLMEIPGFTFPVEDRYLEDYLPELPYKPEPPRFKQRLLEDERKSLREELDKLSLDANTRQTLETLATSTSIPYDLIAAICRKIVSDSKNSQEGILIFLPGVAEIKNTVQAIEQCRLPNCQVIPLHANLSSAEQKRVFAKIAARKIVVATNVAETSITISEIVYVIDSGRLKETQFDPETSLSKLVETYTSRAASRQRRGRAGRTQPGVCYKLFTRRTEKRHMAPFAIPEILRTPLESLFLQVKAMSPEEDVKAYLLRAIDPPKIEAMDAAWKTLVDLGAVQGEELTSRLTALGRHMSIIPVDLRLGKMLVLGCVFRALDPILTIAAMLSSKPLFAGPMEKRDEMKRAREKFAWAKSDILLNLRAYQAASEVRGQSALRSFCEENFISWTTMRDITSLRQDFINSLSDLGYVNSRQMEELNVNAENENLLKAIFTGGMYPRVAQIKPPDAKFEQLQSGTLQKDHEAKELKFFDGGGRVFLHPGSVLFAEPNLKAGYLAYFHKAETSKTFLFDATEIPLFALLLFGGPVTVNHFAGGVMVGKEGHIRLRAWARIGILVNQLRRLLDARLSEAIEKVEAGGTAALDQGDDVVKAMLGLLA